MKKLNGWIRIGIIVSALWIVGAVIYVIYTEEEEGNKIAQTNYLACLSRPQPDFAKCESNLSRNLLAAARQTSWSQVAVLALGPIPVFWLFGLSAFGIFRWIRAGFSTANSR